LIKQISIPENILQNEHPLILGYFLLNQRKSAGTPCSTKLAEVKKQDYRPAYHCAVVLVLPFERLSCGFK
jgi:hypothetical protein